MTSFDEKDVQAVKKHCVTIEGRVCRGGEDKVERNG